MREEWKAVEGYTDYQVSNTGRVVSLKWGNVRELKPDMSGRYMRVTLSDGTTRRFQVHVLVAKHFVPNPKGLPMVNHKDGNKLNVEADNLEWCTCRENTIHAFDTGLRAIGEDSTNAKLTNSQVHEVCSLIQSGLVRGQILSMCPYITKSSFDDLRSRRKWHRVTSLYTW